MSQTKYRTLLDAGKTALAAGAVAVTAIGVASNLPKSPSPDAPVSPEVAAQRQAMDACMEREANRFPIPTVPLLNFFNCALRSDTFKPAPK